ncbi:MAG: endolytic transglycosylase MltG [Actinomycetota bacterium]|nr:endolytic transglycosylase MltG [Actinomycetota bacterium]
MEEKQLSRKERRKKRLRKRRLGALVFFLCFLLVVGIALGVIFTLQSRSGKSGSPESAASYKVVIPEGFTMKEIAERVAESTGSRISEGEFMDAAKRVAQETRKYWFLADAKGNLEGFLFPKTYEFDSQTSAKEAVRIMVEQFAKETSSLDWSRANANGISPYEAVIIASMVEKEAKLPEERPVIASVILNRLKLGMKLQIDATVQYALEERKSALSRQDLEIDSPFNTYKVKGLPPAPISNPGIDSIRAALYPAETDYLYYVLTSPDGKHSFTRDYQEFQRFKKQYLGD